MEIREIRKFIKKNIKPFKGYYDEEDLYRCSAVLTDDTYLPCVIIQEADKRTGLAIKRFEETGNDKSLHKSVGYESIVRTFVCSGNALNYFDIKNLENSKYAIPVARTGEIGGETSMGWTEFSAVMDDDEKFNFGTSFHTAFFDMPPGYSGDRIKKIIPAPGGVREKHSLIFRERPFFNCYLFDG